LIEVCGCVTGPVGPKTFIVGNGGKSKNGSFPPLDSFSFGDSFTASSILLKTPFKNSEKLPGNGDSLSFSSLRG